jgi:hypothetical protein
MVFVLQPEWNSICMTVCQGNPFQQNFVVYFHNIRNIRSGFWRMQTEKQWAKQVKNGWKFGRLPQGLGTDRQFDWKNTYGKQSLGGWMMIEIWYDYYDRH